eukprot:TRINITY_DN49444_c0_g1_i1.p2 TRINITY_DN49444_c0_g1~~TRINITY_DN49444_c0_g1_i1.p2  ORF type:complete len:128 (+),score=16.49 TRINITY_DN49444_c0_g1_i1:74-457(+)
MAAKSGGGMSSNESKTRQRANALLDDLSAQVADRAHRDLGVSKAEAKIFGDEVADHISMVWGGQNIYIAFDIVGRAQTRAAQIYDEFTGDNAHEIAQRHGLSVQYVYRIISRERERRSVKQHNLPLG